MNKPISILSALVVAQIAAAVFVWWPRQSGIVTGQPLLQLKPAAVTGITLSQQQNGKATTLTLDRANAPPPTPDWQLPQEHDFPADNSKVQQLLTQVAALKTSLPVAVTPDAARRFDVAAKKYATLLIFDAGDRKIRLYVGDSAGANLVYVRRPGDHHIYSVELPVALLTTDTNSWQNSALLQLNVDNIRSLKLPGVTLEHKNQKWQTATAKTALDQDKVDNLVAQLADVDFLSVAGRKHELKPSGQGFDAEVSTAKKTLTYHFVSVPANNAKSTHAQATWYLTRSDLPFVFTVSADVATSLQSASTATLATASPKKKKAKA